MNNDFKNDDIRDLIIERDGYLEQVKELEQELQRKNEIIIDFEKWLKSIKGIEINIVKVLNKFNDLKEKYNGTK